MSKLFTVVIPTIGRFTLSETLRSIEHDLADVIVVADTHEMDKDTREYICRMCLDFHVHHLELDAGKHDAGSPQIEYGFRQAQTPFLLNCGDDDIYTYTAFRLMKEYINRDQINAIVWPMMFGARLWPNKARGDMAFPTILPSMQRILRYHVTGQNFVCPNEPDKFGSWVNDWTFMQETVSNFGGCLWYDKEVIIDCL